MVTLFLRQGESGKQVLLSFPATTLTEKADVAATLVTLKSMSRTVTIHGAASEVMNLGLYLSGVDLATDGEVDRINQLAERLEHMSEVDCDKFAGMLDANSVSGTRDILQLTERLDDYVILPGCSSAQSIGKYLIDRGVAPTLKQLCKTIDYEAVGQIFLDAEDKEACNAKFSEILTEQTALKKQKEEILQSSADADRVCTRMKQAEQAIENTAQTITEWNENAVRQIIERVTVLSADEILVRIKGGTEIKQRLER